MTEAPAFPEDHPALAPEVPFGDAALEARYQRLVFSSVPRVLDLLLVLALAAFALIKLGASLSSLLAAVVLHELGHLAGLRLFGYRDAQVCVLGALGAGKKVGVARWKEGAVLLLGPAPGLLLGLALLAAGLRAPSAPLHALAMSLLLFNGLHLLPVAPLDGGRLFRMLLFSRRRFAEVAVLAVAAAALGLFAVQARAWPLLALAVLPLLALPLRARMLRAAQSVRDLPPDLALLAPAQSRRLFTLARATLPRPLQGRTAAAMEQILDAAQPPPRWGATSALLGAWTASVLALCLGLGLLGLAAPARWSEHQSKAGRFAILMPRAPRVIAAGGITLEQAYQGPDRFYQVRWTDGSLRPARPGEVLSDTPVEAAGLAGHELRLRRPGGGVAVVRLLRDGDRGFEIMAIAPREEPETQRFLDSFRLLR